MILSEFEPAPFRLVAQCLSQLRQLVLQRFISFSVQKCGCFIDILDRRDVLIFISLYDCQISVNKPTVLICQQIYTQGPTSSNDFLRINLPARCRLKIQRPSLSSTTDFHPPLYPNKKAFHLYYNTYTLPSA
jgi:hypothetical protein